MRRRGERPELIRYPLCGKSEDENVSAQMEADLCWDRGPAAKNVGNAPCGGWEEIKLTTKAWRSGGSERVVGRP
jgi:hypothetical protein